jgi:serine/threonine protein phosphatase PrpC
MGCVSSKNGEAPETEAKAKAQRRKLSVAPQHQEDGIHTSGSSAASNRKASIIEGIGTLTNLELEAKNSCVIDCVAKSNKGYVPFSKKKVNQDRPMVKFALADKKDVNLFGVMDGHGEFGHLVAQYVMEELPLSLAAQQNIAEDTENAILTGVKDCVSRLPEMKINTAFSGTTCVFGIMNKKRLYVANIGDSRCVVCRQTDAGYTNIDLSEDQKPENPGEKERIINAGGRVEPLPGPPGEDCGPPRVWLKDVDVPGLAMSRSIGDDVSQGVGVISVPEIKQHDIEENDIFAIWASDGVWEFISSEEACGIVWKFKEDYTKAVNELCTEATKRWKQEEEVIDDITAVIVSFNKRK